jgi:conjugative transfer region protein TrbK
MKTRLINWGCVGPLLAFLLVAAGLIAGAIYLAHHSARPNSAPPPRALFGDNLRPELARCQVMGGRAQDDRRCITAWMENRRRFFGGSTLPLHPATPPAAITESERLSQP